MAEVFINGEYVDYSRLERLPIINPANGEEVDTVPLADPEFEVGIPQQEDELV